jgi:hypothetical protein
MFAEYFLFHDLKDDRTSSVKRKMAFLGAFGVTYRGNISSLNAMAPGRSPSDLIPLVCLFIYLPCLILL